ncbi:MAG: thiamine biosynthesis protein ThiF [Dehalococcoidia bacterium]|nr:thiamine biosynthesis protein ThiF [Dehalococcoidia bacterium]
MGEIIRPDQLHRLVKLALDTGEAATIQDAERLFAGYRLGLAVGPDAAASPTLQAAVLTALNASRRGFLGGVSVVGSLDVPLRVPWRNCRTLAEAVVDLYGKISPALDPEIPRIVFGDGDVGSAGAFVMRATFQGWTGGVVPLDDGRRLAERQECVPAGVLAGALGVSEAFQHMRGGNAAAGRRPVGLSLWRPEREVDWLEGAECGPLLTRLPTRAWLIGLGHLGQAFLWVLGLLPYAKPDDVELVLHDYDTLVEANDSTSLLTTRALPAEKKTRAMARWCDARGFRTTIVERRFAADFKVSIEEPNVALCGVDNALARAALEDVGFERVIEAGLGTGTQEYLAFQVHTFPATRSARSLWGRGGSAVSAESLVERPAYRALAVEGLDECGLTTLAGRTVGAPFVGAATAAIVVAELLRMVLGEQRYEVIDATLRALEHRQAVRVGAEAPFNPGWTEAS